MSYGALSISASCFPSERRPSCVFPCIVHPEGLRCIPLPYGRFIGSRMICSGQSFKISVRSSAAIAIYSSSVDGAGRTDHPAGDLQTGSLLQTLVQNLTQFTVHDLDQAVHAICQIRQIKNGERRIQVSQNAGIHLTTLQGVQQFSSSVGSPFKKFIFAEQSAGRLLQIYESIMRFRFPVFLCLTNAS